MSDCIFCKIITKELPAQTIYEDDLIIAFHDRFPKAPTHVLVLPKQHLVNLNTLTAADAPVMWHLLEKLPIIAKQLGLDEGYRTIINTGSGGGQTVFHLHIHVMAGRLPAL